MENQWVLCGCLYLLWGIPFHQPFTGQALVDSQAAGLSIRETCHGTFVIREAGTKSKPPWEETSTRRGRSKAL